MSADWYFLGKGFFGQRKTVGPISDVDLVAKIEKGVVTPETMVSSASKTHGKWIRMKEIRAAKQHWDLTHPKSKSSS
jgi:hypothetical protein